MKIRILQVFFGADGLPYKDQARTVHYPITGNGFQNANNTTQIRFYFSQLSGENTTWVAVSKLPNGKVGSKVLETYIDDELNEPYALLELDSYYTQYKGDIFISLQGYQGGVQVTYDEQTEIYEISGTPTIAATGSIKFTNNYAPSFVGSGQEQNITIQQLLGYLSSKADIGNTIYIVVDIEDEDLSGYEDGQVIYDLFSDLYYEVNSQVQGGHVLANENGLLGNKGALIRFFGLTNTITLQQIYNLIGANRYGALNISGKEYLVIMSANNSIKAYDLLEKKLYSYLDAPNDTFADVLNETPITFVEHRNEGSKVYGTNASAQDTTIPYSSLVVNNGIVQRESTGQIRVPTAPTQSYHATSKSYVDSNYGKKVQLTIDNDTFVLTVKLLNNFDTIISQASVDLPLESIVVSAQYYDTYTYEGVTYTKVLVIVLATTDNPIIVPVGDLVSGLVSETTFNNAVAQLQTNINKCVQQTNTASVVYGTNASGSQTTIKYGTASLTNGIVQRDSRGQITTYSTPTNNTDVANKQYVDTFGRTLEFSIDNSTYVMTFKLKDNANRVISTQTIDLPLETVVVDGYYDSENENLVLELKNGNEITIPISDLISGLVTETSLATTLANYYTKSQIDQMVAGFVFADVDDYLSDSSTNPVENRVITDALETKANVDGNYPTMSVGEATDLSTTRVIDNPEESCPPIVMGVTGGNAEIRNGLQKFQYMEGASEVFNQLCYYETITLSGSAWARSNYPIGSLINGHKYFARIISDITTGTNLFFAGANGTTIAYVSSNTLFKLNSGVNELLLNAVVNNDAYIWYNASPSSNASFTKVNTFDLTLIYGAGNEPTTVDEFKSRFPLDYYAYNAGTILSAKSSALISRGRQQWDEEWELGYYDTNTGAKSTANDIIRCKNLIPCIGNQQYYFGLGDYISWVNVLFYDINKNFIGALQNGLFGQNAPAGIVNYHNPFTTPSNCAYMTFYLSSVYGNTYKHDITLSIYFEDGDGYDQYYPYEAQTVELPNIELRSIGDIKDIAYAQGGGKRKLFKYTIQGNEGVVNIGGWRAGAITLRIASNSTTLPLAKTLNTTNENIRCSCWEGMNVYGEANTGYNYFYFIGLASVITTEQAFRTWVANQELLYELNQEQELTENEGWVENVIVDNYGTLEFVTDPQQIPQVEQPYFIEYTIDLVEFLDSSYTRAGGDASNFALVEEVEQARAEVEEALKNGSLKPANSDLADNFTPYDEDSGAEQNIPFINQGTGCGNGETQVDTGSLALLRKKEGNLVIGNQRLINGDFSNGTNNWSSSHSTISASNNKGTATGLADSTRYWFGFNKGLTGEVVAGHKYIFAFTLNAISISNFSGFGFMLNDGNSNYYNHDFDGTLGFKCVVLTSTSNAIQFYLNAILNDTSARPTTSDYFTISNVFLIDLTQMFGSNDNIPAYLLAHPEAFFNYYQGSLAYNVGTPIVSNATTLKTIGRNLFDVSTAIQGKKVNATGEIDDNANYYASDYIEILPNTSYHFKDVGNSTYVVSMAFYDLNKNFIEAYSIYTSGGGYNSSGLKTSPINAKYVRLSIYKDYVNACVVSIYYEGESGYDQYYPYEVLSEVNTGNEVLRSAGSVRDYKEPNGTIHRLVGRVDLGDLNWSYGTDFYARVLGMKSGYNVKGICGKYALTTTRYTEKSIMLGIGNDYVFITDSSFNGDVTAFKQAMTGVYLFYELAEETTEEGTPFAENLDIDDFGSMMWEGEGFNGIPMGNEIFYTVDYKASLDTLINHCDGDMERIVLDTDLEESEAVRDSVDTQLKEALGGTLRQLLCVKESLDFDNTAFVDLGELDWMYRSSQQVFTLSSQLLNLKSQGYILCSKYKSTNSSYIAMSNLEISSYNNFNDHDLIIKDSSYTSATTLKNSLKNVLLAYEKA